ncbi:MAG: membrane protein insertase YidC [Pirellulales bacterium]|nr:membrane protein insertase YidC [Pirellulales bacterium]
MEVRRIILFVVISFMILVVWTKLFPPPVREQQQNQAQPESIDDQANAEQIDTQSEDSGTSSVELEKVADQYVVLGTHDPNASTNLVVYLTNRGGSIDRVELTERNEDGAFRFGVLEHKYGYLGYLAPIESDDGVKVQAVAPGTPAALAGMQVGDIITKLGDASIIDIESFQSALEDTVPESSINIEVTRTTGDESSKQTLTAELTGRPLEVIDPDPDDMKSRPSQNSMLFSIIQLGKEGYLPNRTELGSLPSMREGNWNVKEVDDQSVTFSFALPAAAHDDLVTDLEVLKTFTLPVTVGDGSEDHAAANYHLGVAVQINNISEDASQFLKYRLDGPNNLTTEGWWYSSTKTRDVYWSVEGKFDYRSAPDIHSDAVDTSSPYFFSVLDKEVEGNQRVQFMSVDSQYFASALIAGKPGDVGRFVEVSEAATIPAEQVNTLAKGDVKTLNTTFFTESPLIEIKPREAERVEYTLFVGPKSQDVLEAYAIDRVLDYGWFGWIARPLSGLLRIFFGVVGNYGVAILFLTILVRVAMLPVSRKATKSAQMMQIISPELNAIAKKYKEDPKKRMAAQQALFRKYNYNPFGSCLLMFLQLPIFIGLYRSIQLDVDLRQRALLGSTKWCSNLAGPDMFMSWEGSWVPMSARGGFLGPYFNLLPIIVIVLFIVQQKLFTPPAQNPEQRMQQRIMKFMFIFMGFLFYRVPSGLCIYFIASSTWSIAERKLIPKPEPPKDFKSISDGDGDGGDDLSSLTDAERRDRRLQMMQEKQRKSKPQRRRM